MLCLIVVVVAAVHGCVARSVRLACVQVRSALLHSTAVRDRESSDTDVIARPTAATVLLTVCADTRITTFDFDVRVATSCQSSVEAVTI